MNCFSIIIESTPGIWNWPSDFLFVHCNFPAAGSSDLQESLLPRLAPNAHLHCISDSCRSFVAIVKAVLHARDDLLGVPNKLLSRHLLDVVSDERVVLLKLFGESVFVIHKNGGAHSADDCLLHPNRVPLRV